MGENEKGENGGSIKETVEAVKGVLQEVPVYKDVVQPGAKKLGTELKPAAVNVGKALTTITEAVNVALAPIRGLVWSYQQLEEILIPHIGERFKDRLQRLVTPPVSLAGPALEALRFVAEEKPLRELYLNLLATAMDEETTERSLPAFVEIIRQMSPDEARIVEILTRKEWFVVLDVTAEFVVGQKQTYRIFDGAGEIIQSTDSYRRFVMIPIHLENLARQRLVDSKIVNNIDSHLEVGYAGRHPEMQRILGLSKCGCFINHFSVVNGVLKPDTGSLIGLTSFGKQFCEVCVTSESQHKKS